jgi:hypothetical protein
MCAMTTYTPQFTETQADRLRKLANHLSYGVLSKSKFDFRTQNGDLRGNAMSNTCGVVGCALGEFHKIFPETFAGEFWVGVDDAGKFMGLSDGEACHLFLPRRQSFGQPMLPETATRFAVAVNMRHFLRMKGFSPK